MNKLDFHPRDYTLLGMSSVMEYFLTHDIEQLLGDRFSTIAFYIKDGVFWFGVDEDERERVSRSYLQKKMDPNVFESNVQTVQSLRSAYVELIETSVAELQPKDILAFFKYYIELIPLVYPSMDAIDFVNVLPEKERDAFSEYAIKLRVLTETIYKRGEEEFIPKAAQVIEREYGISADAAKNITSQEFEAFFLRGKVLPDEQTLRERSTSFLYLLEKDKKESSYIGVEATQKAKELGFEAEDKPENIHEFSGRVAFSGNVQGKVVIVLTKLDISKVTEGSILVASMTQPSYLPAMKKAAAFVTDEGGTLCHAAIVAREMKKPCVIGTEIATKVLKDGDLVEVDAVNGVVKKI
ncbi:MAG: putative phosphoenolpyruvate synthase [Candidatus Magasanikbacteria bacterium GW2011_GWD2_43_18]|nr:MAG: putative phosphoenolpyruvate synthase [Candidatus Magasanikbacteria bacterium GW2011_GWC2_42_27]KKT04427.1 MAG: putative phosphoenolpyruvate synthase [Candidatus Magasanikbacteria bacterium GW2011_GWD2_43_18]KKT26062.1 MAG: putative phosphoenolpyruvate synthase [Candidatus Magasanikbacteria bacterium GW2011_GWA2_43_9]HBB37655.1 hypothetical protein [Candidatus Magasanikbacteria bacterium]HCC13682.1 hypothetical protein [Candidatus Magasanikbacteria bacterium]